MNKAANESISAVYKTGCEIELELAEVTKQRDELAKTLNDLWHYYSLTGAAYELIETALAAVKGGGK